LTAPSTGLTVKALTHGERSPVDKEIDVAAEADVLEDLEVSEEVADAVAGGKKKKQLEAANPNDFDSAKLSY
jgi:hypothetical protein